MRRRWVVAIRVKRYPSVHGRAPHLLDNFVLGDLLSVERRCLTKWGAEREALRLNLPPSLMWRATAEPSP